jgi:hypothetical protein
VNLRRVDAALDERPEPEEEDGDGARDAAERRKEGVDRLLHGIQAAAGKARLGDLLRSDAEEEHHEQVVDEKVQRDVVTEDL